MPNTPLTLTFGMDADAYPLTEKILLRSGVAVFESQLASIPESSPDCAFLSGIVFGNVAHGACDCPIHPFVCTPASAFTSLPTASQVLAGLHIANFESEHIPTLDATQLPYPGYQPGTKNDEIHTDRNKQYLFATEVPYDEHAYSGGHYADFDDETENLSRAAHIALRDYVSGNHLFYVLVHDKPNPHDGFEFSNFVLLFALGVSPATGNLIGAIGSQACHNLCD